MHNSSNLNDSSDSMDQNEADVLGVVDLAISIFNNAPYRNKRRLSSNSSINYKVLTSDEIVQYVVDFVQEANTVIQMKPTVTRMLLSHCKWDKPLLMEKFYQDQEKLFKDAHIVNPFHNDFIRADDKESEQNECEICCAELSSVSCSTNTCGHTFCTSCWSEYLKVKIMDDGLGNSIVCAKDNCDIVVDDETVTELVGNLEAKRRYQHLITNSFVQKNLLLRWCPAPGCSYAIKVDYSPFKPMACTCKCGHIFCFDCAEEWHETIPCEILKRFQTHLREGTFVARTRLHDSNHIEDRRIKKCPDPNCVVSIQKAFGCNVMTCSNCATIFCWECLNRFKTKSAAYKHACKGDRESRGKVTTDHDATNQQNGATHEDEVVPLNKLKFDPMAAATTLNNKPTEQNSNQVIEQRLRLSHGNDIRQRKKSAIKLSKDEIDQTVTEEKGDIDHLSPPKKTLKMTLDETVKRAPMKETKESLTNEATGTSVFEREAIQRIEERFRFLHDRGPDDGGPPIQRFRCHNIQPTRLGEFLQIRERNMFGRYPFFGTQNAHYQKYLQEDAYFIAAVAQSERIKEAMRYADGKVSDLKQLEPASVVLAQTRKTLKYSALFAMFVRNGDGVILFKNLLLEVENAAKELSRSLEKINIYEPGTHDRIPKYIVPAYRNCQLRRRALLDYIDEGYDSERWFFENAPNAD